MIYRSHTLSWPLSNQFVRYAIGWLVVGCSLHVTYSPRGPEPWLPPSTRLRWLTRAQDVTDESLFESTDDVESSPTPEPMEDYPASLQEVQATPRADWRTRRTQHRSAKAVQTEEEPLIAYRGLQDNTTSATPTAGVLPPRETLVEFFGRTAMERPLILYQYIVAQTPFRLLLLAPLMLFNSVVGAAGSSEQRAKIKRIRDQRAESRPTARRRRDREQPVSIRGSRENALRKSSVSTLYDRRKHLAC